MSTVTQATSRLETWLREGERSDFLDAVCQLREAVEHLLGCDGKARTCTRTSHLGRSKTDACDQCPPVDCEDCEWYRNGHDAGWTYQPSLATLLNRIEAHEERLSMPQVTP